MIRSSVLALVALSATLLAMPWHAHATGSLLATSFAPSGGNTCPAAYGYMFMTAPSAKSCSDANLPTNCTLRSKVYVKYACSDDSTPLEPTSVPVDYVVLRVFKEQSCSTDLGFRFGYRLDVCGLYGTRFMKFSASNSSAISYVSCSDSKCSNCTDHGTLALNSNISTPGRCDQSNSVVAVNGQYMAPVMLCASKGTSAACIKASAQAAASSTSTTATATATATSTITPPHNAGTLLAVSPAVIFGSLAALLILV